MLNIYRNEYVKLAGKEKSRKIPLCISIIFICQKLLNMHTNEIIVTNRRLLFNDWHKRNENLGICCYKVQIKIHYYTHTLFIKSMINIFSVDTP